MMPKRVITLLLILFLTLDLSGQIDYKVKADFSYLNYIGRTIQIDPGPDWKGYYLNDGQHGKALSLVNGLQFNEFFFLGIGASYLDFQGTKGHAIFGEMEFSSEKTGLRPLFGIKGGYSHINNHYENGTSTGMIEISGGLTYRINQMFKMQLQTGIMFTQQVVFVPIRIGINFK
ncbi:MAG TPA: hypothetical protein VK169_13455 [Saprospiraceae bacterium]|nr:hypothetical protein [Saprospiraceae bacterium]